MPGPSFGLFLLEGIDQLDGREEAHLATMALHGLVANGGSDVRFASARASDQDEVLGSIRALKRPIDQRVISQILCSANSK
jgi:hypothetical protein